MQVEEFITGWLRMTADERTAANVSRDDLTGSEWVCGLDDDYWVLPGSATEALCRSKGIAFVNE